MKTLRNRLEGFVDGVVAIAVTLLAIELPVPAVNYSDYEHMIGAISPHLHEIAAFILSFATISIFWVNHHRMTQHLGEEIPRRIVWSTMLFLFFQSTIPFATKSMILNDFSAYSILLYSLILFGASSSFSLLHYLTHKHNGVKINIYRTLFGPICYLCACATALLSSAIAYVCLVAPLIYYFLPRPTK